MESNENLTMGGSLLKMKDFEKKYEVEGAYHHHLKGFSKWWMFDNYRILASWLENSGRTLDLACGDGMIWRFLKKDRLIGADHSLSGLIHSRQFAAPPLVQADMRSLPFKAGMFHNAVCSLSLQYLSPSDLERCLGELARILKKDGRLAFSYPNIRTSRQEDDHSHAALPYAEIETKLRRSGFSPVKVRGISLRMPRRLVGWSVRPGGKPIASLYYGITKIGRFFPKRSYHYAVCCVKAGEGFK